MSRLTDTRATLVDALRNGDVLPEWRVHERPPDNVVTPCVWVDVPSVNRTDIGSRGATTLVGTWQVMLLVDGADSAQVALLDEGPARAWDAIDALPMTDVMGMSPRSFDVGGPRTRGMVLTVEVSLMARTLCPPPPLATPSVPVP